MNVQIKFGLFLGTKQSTSVQVCQCCSYCREIRVEGRDLSLYRYANVLLIDYSAHAWFFSHYFVVSPIKFLNTNCFGPYNIFADNDCGHVFDEIPQWTQYLCVMKIDQFQQLGLSWKMLIKLNYLLRVSRCLSSWYYFLFSSFLIKLINFTTLIHQHKDFEKAEV